MSSRTCPACSAESEFLGSLGMLQHYRCRACGMMWNRKAKRRPRPVGD